MGRINWRQSSVEGAGLEKQRSGLLYYYAFMIRDIWIGRSRSCSGRRTRRILDIAMPVISRPRLLDECAMTNIFGAEDRTEKISVQFDGCNRSSKRR